MLIILKIKNNRMFKKIKNKKKKVNKLLMRNKQLSRMKMMALKQFKKEEVNLKQKRQDKLGKKIQTKVITKNKINLEILIM